MKKEIIKPLAIFLLAETVLFGIFVLQNSVSAFFCFLFLIFLAVATFGICFTERNKVFAKAILPPTAEKKNRAKGEVMLENRSAFPVFNAVCETVLKNRLTGEESRINLRLFVPPKGRAKAKFEISSEFCGYITAKVERVYLRDLFGFLFVEAKNFSSEKGKMTVLPETFETSVVFGGVLPIPEDSESYSPDKKGYDYCEPFQIREYVPGDSIKQIHWKLSEKLDRTIVRDPSLPVAKKIILFWDKTAGTAEPSETDAMAEVTSSVAQSLLRSGFEFVLGWNSGKDIEICGIKREEDIPEAIPRMIKSGAEKDEEPEGEDVFAHFGKIICVAKEVPEKLLERTGVSFLICDKTAKGEGIIPFGAKTYAEDLAFLEL